MKLTSKPFRVAQEGATTDGREITRQHIEQMAANYDPKKYGARVWLEHLRGLLPDGLFQALGDVVELTTQEEDGKLGLYASISPTPSLVEMNQKRQKIFSSIELDESFSDTGQAYMVGLAVTDSPASLGTEAMAFSAKAAHPLFAERKQKPGNLFTAAVEVELKFSEEPEDEGKPTLLSRVKDLLGKNKQTNDNQFADITAAVEAIAQSQQETMESFKQLKSVNGISTEDFTKLQTDHTALLEKFTVLNEKIENESNPNYKRRPPASGGNGETATDC